MIGDGEVVPAVPACFSIAQEKTILPVITAASYVKKRLTITGSDFTSAAQVEINGQIINRTFEFDAGTNSLTLKLKYKKLKLKKEFENQIVLIEDGERSQPFILRI